MPALRIFEEEIMKTIFNNRPLKQEDIEKIIPEEIKKVVNYKMIEDRLIFRPKNKYRHFETLHISVFLKNETDISRIIKELLNVVETDCLLYIDFDAIFRCPGDEERPFKFEFGSKNTKVNKTFKIVSAKSAQNLVNEFESQTHPELLNNHYETHKSVMDYVSSGFRPYMLLSMKIWIQTL